MLVKSEREYAVTTISVIDFTLEINCSSHPFPHCVPYKRRIPVLTLFIAGT